MWAEYDGERLVCVAPTAEEARRKYREVLAREEKDGGRSKMSGSVRL